MLNVFFTLGFSLGWTAVKLLAVDFFVVHSSDCIRGSNESVLSVLLVCATIANKGILANVVSIQ
jgi:hypothetical protein